MEVTCFEDRAFFAMIDKVEAYIDSKKPKQSQDDKWVSGEEAMKMLRIISKTTVQKFRDEGKFPIAAREKNYPIRCRQHQGFH
ncbi:helix-turn-helix domain-containing protein [Mucilaginibacter sp. 14171R-50]|uniref:helix-turn-helix domain-containing protein n=1 Tax=Mucilaginibacter sp. 14171R-50 TaxID=2703789 RepID=UPI001EE45734|nr:helix-turn-helix domain-containing protein [Mucilaginibacter sp. 14171R-50]